MIRLIKSIRRVNSTKIKETTFKRCFVGCIVLAQDNKILLQQRGYDWQSFPGFLSSFGGRIEKNETPMQALVRELHEELGADVKESDIISLGAVTESVTDHRELVYEFFWHDKQGTIKGCYEGEAKYFDSVEEVILDYPKVMDDVCWALRECQKRQLLK